MAAWRVNLVRFVLLLLLAAPFPALVPVLIKIGATLRELLMTFVFLHVAFFSPLVFILPLLEEWTKGSTR